MPDYYGERPDYYGARSDTALAIYDAKTRELKRVISGPAETLDEPVSIGKDEIAYAVIEIPGEPLVLPVLRLRPGVGDALEARSDASNTPGQAK